MKNSQITDVIIIGAGPVGLFAVFQCGMLKMRCHVVDALDFVGGQCTALYPEKPIYDIPAHPEITADNLIDNLVEQAGVYEPVYHLGEKVVSVIPPHPNPLPEGEGIKEDHNPQCGRGDLWEITTDKGTTINSKAIIIAAGCGAFGPNRPPIENLEDYEKTGSVVYMVRKKEDFRGKKVVIAGGGDSAVDWALSLVDIADSVSVIHRRPKFRAAPESADKLSKLAKSGEIDLVIPYQLDSIKGANGKLEFVTVKNLNGEIKDIEADVLIPFYGLSMELGEIANWGLSIDKKHIIVDQSTSATNILGIFAIGDISSYNGKLKLILSGFAEAATAAHAIYNIVHPDEALHFEYSTTKGVS